MSHISKIELVIDSLECLQRACAFLGFKFIKNQKTYNWYGRVVNPEQYPLPEGITQDQLGKCDHAIKIPDAEYEVGILKQGEKYILLTDFWDSKLRQRIGDNGGRIKQAYSVERVKLEARKRNQRVTELKIENGIRLVLSV